MRLDKYLARGLGLGSRRDVKKLIKQGRVSITGLENVTPETAVDPENDRVFVDGEAAVYREFAYVMLNKPKGCVSATEDKRYPTVCDFAPEEFSHMSLFPLGRLDIDTEGLCVLTNDGALAHRLLSPKNHVPKTYIAELDRGVTDKDIQAFKDGIVLDDGYKCAPAGLEPIGGRAAEVVICEGRFHQVKRMFAAAGITVTGLRRVKINGLRLDEGLLPGEVRELTEAELALLEFGDMNTGKEKITDKEDLSGENTDGNTDR